MSILIISAVYLIFFILMLPLRNVPFLDDFAYIKNVEEFVRTGNLKITDWASTALVFPVVWGAIFAKIFGFSIKILHVSNIVLFYFGLLSFYGILRTLKIDKFKSVIFTLFLLSYPWISQYLFSFNSDTFYVSLISFAIYFYIKGLSNNKLSFYFLGSIFAGLSFLTRQLAITFPIAFFIILFLKFKIDKKINWPILLVSLLPVVLIILGYYQWISIVGAPAAGYIFFNEYTKKAIVAKLIPQNLQRFGDTNRLYWDLFLQRPSIYFVSICNHMLPFFLMFAFKLTALKNFLHSNWKLIIKVSLISLIYSGIVWIIWKDIAIHRGPREILGVNNIFGDLQVYWPRLFFLGSPFWILIFTLIFKKIKKIFIKRTKPLIPGIIYFSLFVFFFLFLFYKSFIDIYSVDLRPQSYMDPLIRSNEFLRSLFVLEKPLVWIETFKETWSFLAVLSILCLVIYVCFIKNKILVQKHMNLPVIFISLLLLGHFSITNFFAHSHWEEYTIAYVPLLILILANLTKNIPLSKITSIVIIFVIFIFSLQVTRNRYQKDGAEWEIGTLMVQKGIPPAHIGVMNLSWHRYWLWQDAFNKMVETKYKGNKYLINPTEFDPSDKSIPEGTYYNVSSMPASEKPILTTEDYLVSNPYWIITRDPFIVFRKSIIWKVR